MIERLFSQPGNDLTQTVDGGLKTFSVRNEEHTDHEQAQGNLRHVESIPPWSPWHVL